MTVTDRRRKVREVDVPIGASLIHDDQLKSAGITKTGQAMLTSLGIVAFVVAGPVAGRGSPVGKREDYGRAAPFPGGNLPEYIHFAGIEPRWEVRDGRS